MRVILYGVGIAFLLAGGIVDSIGSNWRTAAVAVLFASSNMLIFIWR
jgi:hypothetical protein